MSQGKIERLEEQLNLTYRQRSDLEKKSFYPEKADEIKKLTARIGSMEIELEEEKRKMREKA